MTDGLRIYTPSTPPRGKNGGEYRRPRNVHVLMIPDDADFGNIRSGKIIARVTVAKNVDSRYDGDRSAYGQALEKAMEIEANFYSFATKGMGFKPGSQEFRSLTEKYLHKCLRVDRRHKKYKQTVADIAARRMQA